jgi:hypothetical protein
MRRFLFLILTLLVGPASLRAGDAKDLGWLSRRFEAPNEKGGTRTPRFIRHDPTDPGGTSYGWYQFNTRNGVAQDFVNQYYAAHFGKALPGTAQFDALWQKQPPAGDEEFGKAQTKFAKEKYFDPVRVWAKADLGFDVATHSNSLQRVFWSTAIQHGVAGAKDILTKALQNGPKGDAEIIKRIYAERGLAFKKDATDRYPGELKQALKDLAAEEP